MRLDALSVALQQQIIHFILSKLFKLWSLHDVSIMPIHIQERASCGLCNIKCH